MIANHKLIVELCVSKQSQTTTHVIIHIITTCMPNIVYNTLTLAILFN